MDDEEVSRLRRAVGRLTRALNASATSEGLTPTQASVLGLVATRGPLALATLIELEQINPTMLSRIIGRLVQAGLLRRLADTVDQRAARLEITEKGLQVHQSIKGRRTALVSACIAELPSDHSAALSRAIPALETLAEALAKPR